MSQAPRTLLSIQYLRGMAALTVVAYHTHWTHSELGAAGVDVFFVISGFVMAHVVKPNTQPGPFLRARAVRVVPMYWLATLAMLAVTTRPVSAAHLLQSLAFVPHPGPEGLGWPVVVPGWTLNFEAMFYALFAVALCTRRPLLALAGLLCAAIAATMLHPGIRAAFGAYGSLLATEFLAGVGLHRAWRHGWLRLAWPALPLGLALLAMQTILPAPADIRCLTWGVPALLIVAGGLAVEGMGRLPTVPLLRRLGDASYAIYLVHPLALEVLTPLLRPLPAALAVSLALAACAGAGLGVHQGIERPVMRWLTGWGARRPVSLPGAT